MALESPYHELMISSETLPQYVTSRFKKYGNRVALVDNSTGEHITYAELDENITKLAAKLRQTGLKKADVVGISSHNCLQYPVVVLAVTSCGAVVTACNQSSSKNEMVQLLEIAEPNIMFVGGKALDTVEELLDELKALKKIYLMEDAGTKSEEYESLKDLVAYAQQTDRSQVSDSTDVSTSLDEDLAIIQYSSGTTGLPKGVAHTHRSMVSALHIYSNRFHLFKRDCCYMDRSMFHSYGNLVMLSCLRAGAKLVFDRTPDVQAMLSAVEKHRIIDPKTGVTVGLGVDGDILMKGPQIAKRYHRNPEVTASTFVDGWLRTGDVGHFDEDELIFVIGRTKELIKYKGIQVPPAELEAVLLQHPKIMDAAVIGVPDEEAGELPKAFVVRKDDTLSGNDVEECIKGKLMDYKRLRGGVEFIVAIPKNKNGKINRLELKRRQSAV